MYQMSEPSNTATLHRGRAIKILENEVFPHQYNAAKNTFKGLSDGARAVILAAEMQAGKSGVSLALSCLQRLSLSDDEIISIRKLKDTMYIMTMADVELLSQAQKDLHASPNAVVTNLTRFEKTLDIEFKHQDPKLIIVDECHYGSGSSAVRYEKLFDYIENENTSCKIVFISATPLSALLATEGDSIIRRGIKTKLVFHRASDAYRGVRSMLSSEQVKSISGRTKNILNRSPQRDMFLNALLSHSSAGWALVRVPSGSAMYAKEMLIKHGIDKNNIFILGKTLSGVPKDQLSDIEKFKENYDTAKLFGEKLVAITVAGCRAGINFGQDMKEDLIASWDSTISNIAAVVQANIGRACGYHNNKTALHFTNSHAVISYGKILDYLEDKCSLSATDDIEGLRDEYERICGIYDVRGLDIGARVTKSGGIRSSKKIFEPEVFLTDSYIPIPAQLSTKNPDFSQYTEDPTILETIYTVRECILGKEGIPSVKTSRSIRGKSWITSSWVNGDMFDNPEKALAGGTVKDRIISSTLRLDDDRPVIFNGVIPAGGGEKISKKEVAVFILSVYNESRRKGISKSRLTPEDMSDICNWFKLPFDDTMLLIFKKGELCEERTQANREEAERLESLSPIIESNKFQQVL